MTRDEHLQWAKDRAEEYLAVGDWLGAWNSFTSDLTKHPALTDHAGIQLGLRRMMTKHIHDCKTMREHIGGCN